MKEFLIVSVTLLVSLQGVFSQVTTLDGIFRVSSSKAKSQSYWSCQESSKGNVMCAGAAKPALSDTDEKEFGFCEREEEPSPAVADEGRRLKAGKHGNYGKHYYKHGKYGKYAKYWNHHPEDYYDGRSPSELYREAYDDYYGQGAYDRDFPYDEGAPVNGEFSIPEVSLPETSMPPFSLPFEPPIKFKPPPPKKKFPPKKGKFPYFPYAEEGRRALEGDKKDEPQLGLLRFIEAEPMPMNTVTDLDVTVITVEEDGTRGLPSISFGHQMTNGSYRILHSSIKAGSNAIPSGYYTIVPERSPSGDFKKATCYSAPVNAEVNTFSMVRLSLDI